MTDRELPRHADLLRLMPDGGTARPARLLLWAGFDWLVIGAAWWAMAASSTWLVYVLAVAVIAGRIQALGVLVHDACHRPAASTTGVQWLLLEAVAGWPIGSTIAAMRYHHIRHHRETGLPHDPYRGPLLQNRGGRLLLTLRGLLLPFWWTLRAFVAPLAIAWPALRNPYGRAFLQDRSGQDLRDDRELQLCLQADLRQALAHTCAVLLVFANDLPFVAAYGVPLLLAGVLNARRVVIEHDSAPVAQRSREAVLANTRDHGAGRIGNALLYPHHIGYHVAHHLFPAVSFEHLPAVHAKFIEPLGDSGSIKD